MHLSHMILDYSHDSDQPVGSLGCIFGTFIALLWRIFGTDPPVGPFGRIVGTLSWKSSIVSLVPSSIFAS